MQGARPFLENPVPIDHLELTWRAGADAWTLTLDADAPPRLERHAPGDPDSETPAPPDRSARPTRPAARNPRRGQAWSAEDEEHLKSAFADGISLTAVAASLGRSEGALRARLVRLGLMDESEAGLRFPVAPASGPRE
jgi:hypothetical protein